MFRGVTKGPEFNNFPICLQTEGVGLTKSFHMALRNELLPVYTLSGNEADKQHP